MKKSITTLILGIAAAGAFTTAAAATNNTTGPSIQAPAEAKQAAPAPNGPAAEPNEESGNEWSTMTVPEEPNGPGAKG
jgi:hypothetical protein